MLDQVSAFFRAVPEALFLSIGPGFALGKAAARPVRLGGVCSASLIAVPCLFTACQEMPDIEQRLEENVVVTAADIDANFSDYQTFAIPPVAAARVGLTGNVMTEILDGGLAEALVAQVSALMLERGYRHVELDQAPELGLGIGLLERIQTATLENGYFGSTYGSYLGYPGAGYYYPYSFTYAYRAGSLTLVLLDLKHAQRDVGLPAIWTSIVYRAFPLDEPPTNVQLGAAVEQAFRQSPYLHR